MKFCAVICEFNPFHNGHKYLLGEVKKQTGRDKTLCIMSGNFTQRGDVALLNKFLRARHAVSGGADAVIELPAAFAVAPAELFAQGAVHVLASLKNVDCIAFGCESGTREEFWAAAKATLSEDKAFKAALKENMKDGSSYVSARTRTVLEFFPDIDEKLFTSPNNILGVEYCRAILRENADMEIYPIPRVGDGENKKEPSSNFSSGTALRLLLERGEKKDVKTLKRNVPAQVFHDLKNYKPSPYRQAAVCKLLSENPEGVNRCADCSEGLENRLRAMAKSNPDYDELLKKSISKRYTLSRLKRILAQNFLGIDGKAAKSYLSEPLYCNVLAVNKKDSEEIFSALSGGFPLLVRKSDFSGVKKAAADCLALDIRANDLYNALTGDRANEYETLFI